MSWYIDTSALVKLVVAEPETRDLETWLSSEPREPLACDLVRTELMRAVRRGDTDRSVRAREVLDSLDIVAVTTATFEAAGRLDPAELRSLDAMHIAAALDLGDDLEGMVAYDDRLIDAANRNGIVVVAPGRS